MFSGRNIISEDTFCFFEDLLFKLFETLRSDDFIQSQSWRHHAHTRENLLNRLDFGDDTLRASRLGFCPSGFCIHVSRDEPVSGGVEMLWNPDPDGHRELPTPRG